VKVLHALYKIAQQTAVLQLIGQITQVNKFWLIANQNKNRSIYKIKRWLQCHLFYYFFFLLPNPIFLSHICMAPCRCHVLTNVPPRCWVGISIGLLLRAAFWRSNPTRRAGMLPAFQVMSLRGLCSKPWQSRRAYCPPLFPLCRLLGMTQYVIARPAYFAGRGNPLIVLKIPTSLRSSE
jgi:hypothetical protein